VLARSRWSSIRLPRSALLPAGAKLGLDAYEFVLSEEDFWTAFFTTVAIAAGMTVIACRSRRAGLLMVRTDGPPAHAEPLILYPSSCRRGHCVRLRGGARPGRDLLHPGEVGVRVVPWNLIRCPR